MANIFGDKRFAVARLSSLNGNQRREVCFLCVHSERIVTVSLVSGGRHGPRYPIKDWRDYKIVAMSEIQLAWGS